MSLSYEPLFYMTFTSNIYYWVSMIYTDRKQMYTVGVILFPIKWFNISLEFHYNNPFKINSNKLKTQLRNDQQSRWILSVLSFVYPFQYLPHKQEIAMHIFGIQIFSSMYVFKQIIYVLVSFFGTGNIASVSSFDPNWVRCFVSTFSPFLMASLIILKLLIPVLVVMCAIRQIHSITRVCKLQFS